MSRWEQAESITVAPDIAPIGAVNITVSTGTNFKGTLAASPLSGVVQVTDAHPAGAYTVKVTAFDSVGSSVSKDIHDDCHQPSDVFTRKFCLQSANRVTV
jgi:hypothetical protein